VAAICSGGWKVAGFIALEQIFFSILLRLFSPFVTAKLFYNGEEQMSKTKVSLSLSLALSLFLSVLLFPRKLEQQAKKPEATKRVINDFDLSRGTLGALGGHVYSEEGTILNSEYIYVVTNSLKGVSR
jgi:hypothetical protein